MSTNYIVLYYLQAMDNLYKPSQIARNSNVEIIPYIPTLSNHINPLRLRSEKVCVS